MPDASRPVSSWPHSRERSRGVLGVVEPALEQRDRRAVVLGDVEDERLARSAGPCSSATASSRRAPPRSRRAPSAPRSATPSPRPGPRRRRARSPSSRASVSIARIASRSVVARAPSRSASGRVARPGRSSIRRAIAIAPLADRCGARGRRPGTRARERGRRARRRAASSPRRTSAADASSSSSRAPCSVQAGPPARVFSNPIAARASSSPSPRSRAISAAWRNASSASSVRPCAEQRLAEREQRPRRGDARPSIPIASAVRRRAAASS